MKIILDIDDFKIAVTDYLRGKLNVDTEDVDLSKLKGTVTVDLPAVSIATLGSTTLDVLPNKVDAEAFAPKEEVKEEPIKTIEPTPVEEVKEILEEGPVTGFAGFDQAVAAPTTEVVEEAPVAGFGEPVEGFSLDTPTATGNELFVPPVVAGS